MSERSPPGSARRERGLGGGSASTPQLPGGAGKLGLLVIPRMFQFSKLKEEWLFIMFENDDC